MNNDFRGLYVIRDAVENDFAYIYSTFLNGLYYGNSWFRLIPKDLFMDRYKLVVRALLDGTHTIVKIAALKEDPDIIIGYIIYSADCKTIHWINVKSSKNAEGITWRRHGIARTLLPPGIQEVSHLTNIGLELLTKLPGVIFNPFINFGG